MALDFKGAHFPPEVILMGVRWYVAYPLSTRHVEALMEERGVEVDHSTINRWVIKYSPQLEEAFHRRKRPVWVSWRMDETYIKVKGQWRYLYRAVDKQGQTIDFLLTEHRDKEAALRFLKKAIRRNGLPETITIDGSDANEAAIKSYNEEDRKSTRLNSSHVEISYAVFCLKKKKKYYKSNRVMARPSFTWPARTSLVSPHSRPPLHRRRNHNLSSRLSPPFILYSDLSLTTD